MTNDKMLAIENNNKIVEGCILRFTLLIKLLRAHTGNFQPKITYLLKVTTKLYYYVCMRLYNRLKAFINKFKSAPMVLYYYKRIQNLKGCLLKGRQKIV